MSEIVIKTFFFENTLFCEPFFLEIFFELIFNKKFFLRNDVLQKKFFNFFCFQRLFNRVIVYNSKNKFVFKLLFKLKKCFFTKMLYEFFKRRFFKMLFFISDCFKKDCFLKKKIFNNFKIFFFIFKCNFNFFKQIFLKVVENLNLKNVVEKKKFLPKLIKDLLFSSEIEGTVFFDKKFLDKFFLDNTKFLTKLFTFSWIKNCFKLAPLAFIK